MLGSDRACRAGRILRIAGKSGAGALAPVNEADDAGPSLHTVAIAPVDHLVEPSHRSLRRADAMPLHHRHGETLDLDLGVEHCPNLRAEHSACLGMADIKPRAITNSWLNDCFCYFT